MRLKKEDDNCAKGGKVIVTISLSVMKTVGTHSMKQVKLLKSRTSLYQTLREAAYTSYPFFSAINVRDNSDTL